MKNLLLATSIFCLTACNQAGPADAEHADPSAIASSKGWRISVASDLNDFFDCLEAENATLVSAHRGGAGRGFPENALETMEAVLESTPALMEIDVATSADGVLFLMHDDTLDRTTTGSGSANAAPWSEISKLNLRDDDGRRTSFTPPRFSDVLAWADGKTVLQIDFKRSTSYEDVAAEIRRQNAEDRVILISYSMASAAKLHRLAPGAMISLSVNSQSEVNRAIAAGVPADRLMGFTGTESIRPRLFSSLNNSDIEVIFGTLGGRTSIDQQIASSGDADQYVEIAAAGVDIIATDRPRESHAALRDADRAPEPGQCGINLER